jgi:Fe-S oxidoreductase
LGFEVFHISQFLSQEIKKGSLKFKENHLRLTFHDPCRLGRQMNVYDAPRDVLQAIPGIELREMLQTRSRSLCCGTSSFINCGKDSKKIQLRRLRQAKDTGADTMIVSCPKCFIHFSCAIKDKDAEGLEIKIQDLSDIIAKNIKEE